MNEALQMSSREILPDLHNVTFSRALEDGLTHYGWLAGRRAEKCGQDRVHASHSVLPEKVEELTTRDTFGPLFGGLSPSAGLQRCLESRLQVLTEGNGSPEYELTWKRWDIGSGLPIYALRASGRRTSDSGCGGWVTPQCKDFRSGQEKRWLEKTHAVSLNDQVVTAGWITPKASDCKMPGISRDVHLNHQAIMAGWKTPHATDGEGGVMEIREGANGHYKLRDIANLAGWSTPAMRDYKGANDLEHTTEKIAEGRRGHMGQLPNAVMVQLTGSDQFGGRAVTDIIGEYLPDGWTMPENGKLNPAFSLWLMGYPAEWVCCGVRAMQSCRKKGRCS